jgi:hypothetical protein
LARIAPGHDRAERHAIHTGNLGDAADRLFVKGGDVGRLALVRHHRHVHGQHVAAKSRLLALQREQGGNEHAGAGDQHERRGDLRDGEQTQATVRA